MDRKTTVKVLVILANVGWGVFVTVTILMAQFFLLYASKPMHFYLIILMVLVGLVPVNIMVLPIDYFYIKDETKLLRKKGR